MVQPHRWFYTWMRYPVGYQRLGSWAIGLPGFFFCAAKLAGWQAGLAASVLGDQIHLLAVSTQMVACRKVHTPHAVVYYV